MTTLSATAPAIRIATDTDVPRLVAMFQQFVASSQYEKYVGRDPAFCTAQMARIVASADAIIYVVEHEESVIGMLGGVVFQQPFSGEIIASELFWWLDPNHRGHGGWLLKRFEKWAAAKGATRVQMMAPIDKPRVAETYVGLGYASIETIYQRNLP